MSEAVYALVFQGDILQGFERGQVMQRCRELFGLSEEDAARMFAHPRVVLKRNLSHAAAHAFRERLMGIGMAVSVDALAALAPDGETAVRAHDGAGPAAATPANKASTDDAGRHVSFAFSGEGFEFFRIWIVNILLTIVTLGVYSAWAKVRTQRYFYGNTRLDGASFEYLADPLRILKGRLIAFALFVVYLLADQFVPLLGAVLMLAFFAILPWVIVRAVSFRNHYSAWRGVRFGFEGGLGEAYKVFLLWPLLGVLTLGVLLPYAMFRQQRFVIGGCRYGTAEFEFGARAGKFYVVFLAALGVLVAGGIVTALVAFAVPLLAPLLMVAAYLVAFALFNVMLTNLRFNHASLYDHCFEADYRLASYAMLMLTNTLGIILTLGLFYPWARVRSARYAAAHISVRADGDLDAFVAMQREEVSAIGGEIGDVFDVDIGI